MVIWFVITFISNNFEARNIFLKVWSLYREFETSVLQSLIMKNDKNGDQTPPLNAEMDSDNESSTVSLEIEMQVKLIRQIWRKQISKPHESIEDIYRAYQQWEYKIMDSVSSDYKTQYYYYKSMAKHFRTFEREYQALETLGLYFYSFV